MIKVISLTDTGRILGVKLEKALKATGFHVELLCNPKPFKETIQYEFQQGHRLIFISAIAIAVRVLAPVLKSKYEDPAVLVLDETGKFVIPLLSGHEGGANILGDCVAKMLNAQLVSTTANPYLHPVYTVGMGCERHCPEEYLQAILHQCLDMAEITKNHLHSINSIDIKADERALITLSQSLSLPFCTWNVHKLRLVESLLSQRSEYVFNTVGVYGVAESAALIAAQEAAHNKAELVVCKIKNAKATCAIARSFVDETDKTSVEKFY